MVTATLTSKGQVTIPKPVRDSLRLRTGDRVAFILRGHAGAGYKRLDRPGGAVLRMQRRDHLR